MSSAQTASHLQRKSFRAKFEKYFRACQEKCTEPTSLKLLTFWRMKEASNLQGSSLTGTKKKINPSKRKEIEGEKLPMSVFRSSYI